MGLSKGIFFEREERSCDWWMEESTAVPTRVPAGVESVKIMSFLIFKMMAV